MRTLWIFSSSWMILITSCKNRLPAHNIGLHSLLPDPRLSSSVLDKTAAKIVLRLWSQSYTHNSWLNAMDEHTK